MLTIGEYSRPTMPRYRKLAGHHPPKGQEGNAYTHLGGSLIAAPHCAKANKAAIRVNLYHI